ncbi:flagellar biosynthesis protein FlhG [Natranaerovirga pectinivora]|uniref:Flagellar biosynthesis protein FlhG n=1 Tax=Natranaerovirga pectinivora TaxID=682400 RepID=A0A4R3MKT6_9FIRM|nr:MinD/ParA family protein [Natranaerovirga pectinivora]TCT15083.1 flagellar biosynthesis protein FlhG [Natranaerovirga pectinivora]
MDQAAQLRNMIKQQNQHKTSARVITVTSGKGGVGKTNVSVNLAIQFKKMGKRVIILDADFGLANIEVLFGIIPGSNLGEVMFNGKEIKDILTPGPLGIEFISGGSGIQELTNLGKEQLFFLLQKLNEIDYLADIIIIDTGAGISSSVLEFVLASKEVLLVSTPEPTSITDSYALLKALKKLDTFDQENTSIKVITNRASSVKEGENVYSKLNVVVNKFLDMKIEHLGIVPQDQNLQRAVMEQKPISLLYPNSSASKAFKEIAEKLLEVEQDRQTDKNSMSQFLTNFIKIKKLFK